MAELRAKACAYLRNSAVIVSAADRGPDPAVKAPVFVAAHVQGHHALYQVHLLDGRWTCSCKAVFDDGEPCAHLAAVQLVTGHPSGAALSEKQGNATCTRCSHPHDGPCRASTGVPGFPSTQTVCQCPQRVAP